MVAPAAIHTEEKFENIIADALVRRQGYRSRTSNDFDRPSALDRELVVEFVKTTQPEKWEALEARYASAAAEQLLKVVQRSLEGLGTIATLRDGVKLVPNIEIKLCFFKPASGLNQDLRRKYEGNILSVIRQLRYSGKHDNELDLALFVNGIPVATAELKNQLTGTTYRHAQAQYKQDRKPLGEPLLSFKRGAIVHFAMDTNNVSMTTRLENGRTRFLPFDRGHNGHAGNPDIQNDFRTAYMWTDQPEMPAIWSRDVWLEILGNFVHLEKPEVKKGEDKKDVKEAIIFPRYHQLSCVRDILRDAAANGAGINYLIQHSAGSGKSNTIAWAAHRLATLHDADDVNVFDGVIIVTDRVVLDRQLQKTVKQFEKTDGFVKQVREGSKELAKAIKAGKRIIISTIHKFSTDHLKAIEGQAGKRFAVIIDEAHSSAAGEHAENLKGALSREEGQQALPAEELIAKIQKDRGPAKNISYFAFTATPRNVTLEIFGRKASAGATPRAFHVYSMRQAIEEGFILDVLQNYMTYASYMKLEKAIEDDPELDSRMGARRIARFVKMHDVIIDQKVEVIVEHFRRHAAEEIGGKAKAMIVTSSREHAYRYYQGVRRYIEECGYTGLKALIAFSGPLSIDGAEPVTEAMLNGFAETELPKQFEGAEYQVLIVAEKYQTGFDQPLLCAMYIDRKLAGIQAVQTLSRLNRTHPEKTKTFVLDFANTTAEIAEAFAPYVDVTALSENTDPNHVYELSRNVLRFGYILPEEASEFTKLLYAADPEDVSHRQALEQLARRAVERFEEDDEDNQEEFRQGLASFGRFYSFISQIVSLEDVALEELSAYGSWVKRLLPKREGPDDGDISADAVRLAASKLTETSAGAIVLPDETVFLDPISEFGVNPYTAEETKALSEIVDSFNERYGLNLTPEDFYRFERTKDTVMQDDIIVAQMQNNPKDVVDRSFNQAFTRAMMKTFQSESALRDLFMTDAVAKEKIVEYFFNRAFREVRSEIHINR